MSGLEEFQTCEAWKKNLKKFLFMERKPEAFKKTATESQRYSLDIDEDLKNIIEEKKKKRAPENSLDIVTENTKSTMESGLEKKEKMIRVTFQEDKILYEENDTRRKRPDDSFEALEKMCEKTISDPNSTLYKYLNVEEEHNTNNFLVWEKTSDESFEALEKMCDKTASDPNTTLFQYLHGNRKDEVLAKAKKHSADDNSENIRERQDNLFVKLNNCTLLDDVEAPSRMWENTICDEPAPQTSPIKMVGLLRPSTIIEEAADEIYNSDISSQLSFKTATKAIQGDVSSSTYDTAHDSTATSNQTDNSVTDRKQELEIIDVDHILLPVLKKIHEQNMEDLIIPTISITDDATIVETSSLSNEHNSLHTSSVDIDLDNDEQTLQNDQKLNKNPNLIIPTLNIIDATIVKTPSLSTDSDKEEINNTSNDSTSLIDLEQIFGNLCKSSSSSLVRDSSDNGKAGEQNLHALNKTQNSEDDLLTESVIELSDDDEEEENKDINTSRRKEELCVSIKLELTSKKSFSLGQDTYCFTLDDNKENEIDMGTPADKSMQFNDTMEEVEYMLKKGMEYMAAEAASKQDHRISEVPDHSPKQHSAKIQSSSPVTSIQQPKNVSAIGSKVKSSTYCTPAKKSTPATKSQNLPRKQFDMDIRPFPKLDIFSKVPVQHARHKELASKQEKFSHIISPIGAYMKKTARTPLMSSINSKVVDNFNSTAIQELENESRLYQSHFAKSSGEAAGLPPKLPGLINGKKTPLPKKAYISSDLKHIVDERTPVTIPGGKKIQKYLENAIMPAVLRHDGKFKIPGTGNKLNTATPTTPAISVKQSLKASDTNTTGATKISHIPRRNNASLADLSLMSGDVSMYTIMDAQKF